MCYARSASGSQVPPATCIWPWPVDVCLGVQRLCAILTIVTIYRDSHDTIQKGTNNCEIPAISIITLNELLSNLFFKFHRLTVTVKGQNQTVFPYFYEAVMPHYKLSVCLSVCNV